MKKYIAYILFILLAFAPEAGAEVYYVHPERGSDGNRGTSPKAPWKTLGKVNKARFMAGDRVLFAAGTRFYGTLSIRNQEGAARAPIVFSSYPNPDKPEASHVHINGRGQISAVAIINSSHIHLEKFSVTAEGGGIPEWVEKMRKKQKKPEVLMRVGVLVEATKKGVFENIRLSELIVKDIFFYEKGHSRAIAETQTQNGTQEYGYGIRFMARNGSNMNNIHIANSLVQSVSHTGIKFTPMRAQSKISNILIENNRLYQIGGPGIQISRGHNIYVHHNIVDTPGSKHDSRNWQRGSGMWTWGSHNALIEHNQFMNADGTADSAGFHIDFNCKNIIVQYNLSKNNTGGFVEILGNNHNSAYRYNVSINDGARNKGVNHATHDGKIMWLSGYVGKGRQQHGPYNSYVYNNTVYVSEGVLAKFAVAKWTQGAFIANNIFHIVGKSKGLTGRAYKLDPKARKGQLTNMFFENNLFLKKKNWPKNVLIQPKKSMFGNVQFTNAGGGDIRDYIPRNKKLVKDKGIAIRQIMGDDIGLIVGLRVEKDILGNPIRGLPDMGAIEME